MNPRIRRLTADYNQMVAAFKKHPFVRVTAIEGKPPESYSLRFNVVGLVPDADGKCSKVNQHSAQILMPLEYPRRPPLCRMTSPVFHPNIDPQKICIGDHWNAGQTLPSLIIRIAEMITYQSYNIKSPLNAEAAAWAEQNESQLPLQAQDFGY